MSATDAAQGRSKHFYSDLAGAWHSEATPLYDIILRIRTYWNVRSTVPLLARAVNNYIFS